MEESLFGVQRAYRLIASKKKAPSSYHQIGIRARRRSTKTTNGIKKSHAAHKRREQDARDKNGSTRQKITVKKKRVVQREKSRKRPEVNG